MRQRRLSGWQHWYGWVGLWALVWIGCTDSGDDDGQSPGPETPAGTESPLPTSPGASATPVPTPTPTQTPDTSQTPALSPTPETTGTPGVTPTETPWPTAPPTATPEPTPTPTPGPADLDGDTFAEPEDCNDDDATVYPGALEVPYDGVDQDCSGSDLTDVDNDGVASTAAGGTDCDDHNANTYPGAPEYADGQDNDCNGQIDDGLATTDDDGDGFSEATGDCNDADTSIYPDAEEVPYDGIDQDCTGLDLTDVDGDGYDGLEVSGGTDCDDEDAHAYPDATEVPYDGIDQDCTGLDLTDVDGDGYASTAVGGSDCNDQNANIHPGVTEVPYDGVDQDCSGRDLTDVDGDGYDSTAAGGSDCNDANSGIHPGANEVCNGIDDNCDGVIDTDAVDRGTYYVDADLDGYGNATNPVLVCTPGAGQVKDSSDCDDTNAQSYPGATEVCDTRDNNCNGAIDEGVTSSFYQDSDGDGYGNSGVTVQACSAPTGYVATSTDCDDTRASVHPGATETCNGLDDDCNGAIDEGVKSLFYADADGDGYGNSSSSTQACSAPSGYVADSSDCDDTKAAVHPNATEICNAGSPAPLDDDCDGQIDEGVPTSAWYSDQDGDTYGKPSVSTQACSQPTGYVADNTDCNDSSPAIHPGATEVCNSVDDNCDTQVDEGVKSTFYQDNDNDGYGNPRVSLQACTKPAGYVVDATDCNDASASIRYCPTCKDLLASGQATTDGMYNLDPCGTGNTAPYYCDMTSLGGGWTVGGWQNADAKTNMGIAARGTVGQTPWSSNLACVGYSEIMVFNRTYGQKYKQSYTAATWNATATNMTIGVAGTAFKQGTYGPTGSLIMMGCVDYTYQGGTGNQYACDNDSTKGQKGHITDYAGEFCSGGRLDNTWAWTDGATCLYRGQQYVWGFAIR